MIKEDDLNNLIEFVDNNILTGNLDITCFLLLKDKPPLKFEELQGISLISNFVQFDGVSSSYGVNLNCIQSIILDFESREEEY